MIVKPIKPYNLPMQKVPGQIVEAVNNCVARSWDGRQAVLRQDHVITEINRLINGDVPVSAGFEKLIFKKRWLDFEPTFIDAGWDVKYEAPIPRDDEDFEPFWVFKSKPAFR